MCIRVFHYIETYDMTLMYAYKQYKRAAARLEAALAGNSIAEQRFAVHMNNSWLVKAQELAKE